MSDANNRMTVEDSDGERFIVNTSTIVSDIHAILLSKRRKQTFLMPWNKMPEADQQDEIVDMVNLAQMIVRKVVDLVAERGLQTIAASLENFTLKDGKLTLKVASLDDDETILAISHNIGKTVKIMMANSSQFDTSRTAVAPMPDQGDLLAGDPNDIFNEADDDDLEAQVEASFGEGAGDTLDGSGGGEALPANDSEPLTPRAEGYQAYLDSKTENENPFNEETAENSEWGAGWNKAADDAAEQRRLGREAFAAGGKISGSGYKKGTDADEFWREGFEEGKAAAKQAATETAAPDATLEDIQKDSEDFDAAAADLE